MSAKKKTSGTNVVKNSKYWVNLVGSLYSWVIICVVFFGIVYYLPDEYYSLVTYKFGFLVNASKIIAIFLGFFLLVYFGGHGISAKDLPKFKPILGIDIAMVFFFFAMGISYICSDFKFVVEGDHSFPAQGAFYGTTGWYVGFVLYAICVMLYFIVAHFLQYSDWIFLPIILSTVGVNIWSILNRFGYSLFGYDAVDPGFLASLGNINWYSGYLSVLLPIMVGLYWYKGIEGARSRAFLCLPLAIGFMISVINGSDSGVFALGIMLIFLIAFSFSDVARLRAYSEVLLIFGVSNFILSFIRKKNLVTSNYSGEFMDLLNRFSIASAILVVSVVLFVLALLFATNVIKYPELIRKAGGPAVAVLSCAGFFGIVLLIIINTKLGGTLPVIGQSSFFLYDDYWGSHRGAIWKAGLLQFFSLDFLHKLVGVGPDCFYDATRYNLEVFDLAQKHFPGLRLTNCHNGFITMLINTGVFGVTTFGAVLFLACKSTLSKLKDHPKVMIVPLAIVTYLANNVVSFQTIMNIPFLFVLIAIGSAMLVDIERQE